MDKKIKREWITALRSGEYKQVSGALCKLNGDGSVKGHCCLGVACEVAIKNGLDVDVSEDDINSDQSKRRYAQSTYWLPASVQGFYGFANESGFPNTGDTERRLTEMNDRGEPFDYIADVLEKEGDNYEQKGRE